MTLVSLTESLTPRLDVLEGLKIFSYFSAERCVLCTHLKGLSEMFSMRATTIEPIKKVTCVPQSRFRSAWAYNNF